VNRGGGFRARRGCGLGARFRARRGDVLLGLACIAFALALLAVWIPLDVDGGITERARGAARIGDALAPWVAGVLVALAGALLLVEAWRGDGGGDGDGDGDSHRDHDADGGANRGDRAPRSALQFLAWLVAIFTVTLALYRWTGPAAVELARLIFPAADAQPVAEYRLLRDTVPWKYLGYFAGSWFMVFALIALTERRCTWRAALIAAVAPALIALCYDAPFDDLLLPPNGDV